MSDWITGGSRPATPRPKYNNQKIEVGGHMFDSKAESYRYLELKALQQAGKIQGYTIQPSFLLPGGIRYRPDFMVMDSGGRIWVEDVKGFVTQAFKLKRKLWDATYGDWLPLVLIKNGKAIPNGDIKQGGY